MSVIQSRQVVLHQNGFPAVLCQGCAVLRGDAKGGEDQLRVGHDGIGGHLCSRLKRDSSIIPLQIWDTPSNFDLDHLDVPLSSFSTIIYVMDMQASILNDRLPLDQHG